MVSRLMVLWKRRQLLKRPLPAVLKGYIEHLPLLGDGDLAVTSLLSTDLELTGLDITSDEVVSIGTVFIERYGIRLGSAQESIVRSLNGVGQSAVCHQLTDRDVRDGIDLMSALLGFFHQAQGKVLLFHHGTLDLSFIKQACRREFGVVPPFVYIDTQVIEQRRRHLSQPDTPMYQLRLPECRKRYGLPEIHGHKALSDAIATGELLLAQLAAQGVAKPKLKDYWLFG